MPAISVIVPVYNVEKYLPRCIDSILAQTYTDFELLLIDDGSPDSSGQICDDYAKKDTRIRVFHKPNGGVSSARNMGLDNLKGEYFVHVDSDDYIEPNMLAEMYQCISSCEADVVITDYFYFDRYNKIHYCKNNVEGISNREILTGILETHISPTLWTKMFRSDVYRRFKLHRFPNFNYGEDLIFMVDLFKHSDVKTKYLNKAFYHYEYRPTSYVNTCCDRKHFFWNFELIDELKEILPEDEFDNDIKNVEKKRTSILIFFLILYPEVVWERIQNGNFVHRSLLVRIIYKLIRILISIINKINNW